MFSVAEAPQRIPAHPPDLEDLGESARVIDLGFRTESRVISAAGFLNRVWQVRILPRALLRGGSDEASDPLHDAG